MQPFLFPVSQCILALSSKRAYVFCKGYRPVLVRQLLPDYTMEDLPRIDYSDIVIGDKIAEGGLLTERLCIAGLSSPLEE